MLMITQTVRIKQLIKQDPQGFSREPRYTRNR